MVALQPEHEIQSVILSNLGRLLLVDPLPLVLVSVLEQSFEFQLPLLHVAGDKDKISQFNQ